MLDYQRVPAKLGLKQQQKRDLTNETPGFYQQRDRFSREGWSWQLNLRRNLGGPYIVDHELSKEVPSGEAPGKAVAWSRSVWVSWTKNGWFVIEKGLNNWCPLSLVPDHTSIYLLIQSVVEFLETQTVMQLVSRSRSPGQILWINNSFFCGTCLFCRIVVESFTASQSSSD